MIQINAPGSAGSRMKWRKGAAFSSRCPNERDER